VWWWLWYTSLFSLCTTLSQQGYKIPRKKCHVLTSSTGRQRFASENHLQSMRQTILDK
jgi:hypothetical protein